MIELFLSGFLLGLSCGLMITYYLIKQTKKYIMRQLDNIIKELEELIGD